MDSLNKIKTEIIFNGESIFDAETSIIMFEKNDIFYFSIRDYSPKSKGEYIQQSETKHNIRFKDEFWSVYFEKITQKANDFHIKQFKVIKVSKSLSIDYSVRKQEFYISYTVVEYFTLYEKYLKYVKPFINLFRKR
jgi:hypothetical protein